jgi:hypothetical protein
MSALDCTRVQELLSDLHEETLDAIMQGDALEHLAGCAECRELRAALAEVRQVLQPAPALDPAKDLPERAANAALAAGRRKQPRLRQLRGRWAEGWDAVPGYVHLLAATLAIAATGGTLMAAGYGSVPAPRRMFTRVVNTGVYLVEKKDRVVEDIRILRVVIATAFEGRLDRMNDRVDDYRRLMERRRLQEQDRRPDGKKSKAGLPELPGPAEQASLRAANVNRTPPASVEVCEPQHAGQGGPALARS